ncbi:MAG TPA: 4Fe-4S ferredoxin [Nitrospiria bacterium]|nr:4Fe-4S ferredoxin [Nitrospiria bacterium]
MPTTMTEKTATPLLVSVEIMGKPHRVPQGITVLQAMWYAGHELIRGVGCLGGTCGACGIVYRTKGSFELKNGLGCQTLVQEGMSFSMVPHFAAARASYKMAELADPKEALFELYPEAARCVNCNACNRVCPQGIDVRGSIWCAVFGNFDQVAELTMSCNSCGLCVVRCPADMAPNLIALYARRAYGVHELKPPKRLTDRIEQIDAGAFRDEWARMQTMDDRTLAQFCANFPKPSAAAT